MGTFTAQILVGDPHPNHGGISPSHQLLLSENDRPAWILFPLHFPAKTHLGDREIRWIPTIEGMLEDALLMIAVHVCRHGEILEFGRRFCSKLEFELFELDTDLNLGEREALYKHCRDTVAFPKLIMSVFKGSSVTSHLSVLENYSMDVEVCIPVYSRYFSSWTHTVDVEGSLPGHSLVRIGKD
jgi:hypothetical protein